MSEAAGEHPCRGNHPPSPGDRSQAGRPMSAGYKVNSQLRVDPRRLIQCPSLLFEYCLRSASAVDPPDPGIARRPASPFRALSTERPSADTATIRHTGGRVRAAWCVFGDTHTGRRGLPEQGPDQGLHPGSGPGAPPARTERTAGPRPRGGRRRPGARTFALPNVRTALRNPGHANDETSDARPAGIPTTPGIGQSRISERKPNLEDNCQNSVRHCCALLTACSHPFFSFVEPAQVTATGRHRDTH